MTPEQAKENIYINIEAGEGEKKIIDALFDRFLTKALAKTNRKESEHEDALLMIVADATEAAYNKRGVEGVKSSSEGSQTYSYTDIDADMNRALIQANLRLARF